MVLLIQAHEDAPFWPEGIKMNLSLMSQWGRCRWNVANFTSSSTSCHHFLLKASCLHSSVLAGSNRYHYLTYYGPFRHHLPVAKLLPHSWPPRRISALLTAPQNNVPGFSSTSNAYVRKGLCPNLSTNSQNASTRQFESRRQRTELQSRRSVTAARSSEAFPVV